MQFITAPKKFLMFSDHLRKVGEFPVKPVLFAAAGLAIVCQLVAMVMVVSAQVEKAQMRDASHASARAAMAGCIESSRGAALRDCERTSPSFAAQSDYDQVAPTRQGITLFTQVNRQ